HPSGVVHSLGGRCSADVNGDAASTRQFSVRLARRLRLPAKEPGHSTPATPRFYRSTICPCGWGGVFDAPVRGNAGYGPDLATRVARSTSPTRRQRVTFSGGQDPVDAIAAFAEVVDLFLEGGEEFVLLLADRHAQELALDVLQFFHREAGK